MLIGVRGMSRGRLNYESIISDPRGRIQNLIVLHIPGPCDQLRHVRERTIASCSYLTYGPGSGVVADRAHGCRIECHLRKNGRSRQQYSGGEFPPVSHQPSILLLRTLAEPLVEFRFRLFGEALFLDGFRRGGSYRQCVEIIGFAHGLHLAGANAGRTDHVAVHRVIPANARAGLVFHTDGKCALLREHRKIAALAALDIRGLVTMMPQAPDKHAVAVEIVILTERFNSRPEPDVFLFAVIIHLADGKIRHYAMPCGVLRDVIRNEHVDAAGEHPAGLAGSSTDQGPVIVRDGRRVLIRFYAAFLRERNPIDGHRRRGGRRRRGNDFLLRLFRRDGRLLDGVRQFALRRFAVAHRDAMRDHFEDFLLLQLNEAGGSAAGLGVDVQHIIRGGLALRGESSRLFGEPAQAQHLGFIEKLPVVGPAFDSLLRPNPVPEPAFPDDLDVIAVMRHRDSGRFRIDFFADIERGGADVSIAHGRRALVIRAARAQQKRGREDAAAEYCLQAIASRSAASFRSAAPESIDSDAIATPVFQSSALPDATSASDVFIKTISRGAPGSPAKIASAIALFRAASPPSNASNGCRGRPKSSGESVMDVTLPLRTSNTRAGPVTVSSPRPSEPWTT